MAIVSAVELSRLTQGRVEMVEQSVSAIGSQIALPGNKCEPIYLHNKLTLVKVAPPPCQKPDLIFSIGECAHESWGHSSDLRVKNTLLGSSSDYLKIMLKDSHRATIRSSLKNHSSTCRACVLTKNKFTLKLDNYNPLLDVKGIFVTLHSDLFTVGGLKFVSLMCADTKYLYVDQVHEGRSKAAATILMQRMREIMARNYRIGLFVSDNGSEFHSIVFKSFLKEYGIDQRDSIPHEPKSNSLIERAQGTILNMIRATFVGMGLPTTMVPVVMRVVVRQYNCTRPTKHGMSPTEAAQIPEVITPSDLIPLGATVAYKPHFPVKGDKIFDTMAKTGLFLGPSFDHTAGYKVLTENSGIVTVPSVKFLDTFRLNTPYASAVPYGSLQTDLLISLGVFSISTSSEVPRYDVFLQHPEWVDSLMKELNQLKSMNAFTMIDAEEKEAYTNVPVRWIHTVKSDGTKKSRLVLRGDKLPPEEVPEDCFSPTINPEIIKAVNAMCLKKGYTPAQFDIHTAFLHADFPKDRLVACNPPRFYELIEPDVQTVSNPRGKKKVILRLSKALYGHPNSPLLFHLHLKDKMTEIGAIESKNHPCVWKWRDAIVLVYVDDLLVWSPDETTKTDFLKVFGSDMQLKRLDFPAPNTFTFIGVTYRYTKTTLEMYRKPDLKNSLAILGPLPGKATVPISKRIPLDDGPSNLSVREAQQIAGELGYLATSRPDIAFATHVLQRFSHAPTKTFDEIALQTVDYVYRHPIGYKYHLGDGFEIYIDSDHGSDPVSRYPICCFVIVLFGVVVQCKVRTSKTVSLSSTHAELHGLVNFVSHLSGFIDLVTEVSELLGLETGPIAIRMDNKAVIDIVHNTVRFSEKFLDLYLMWVRKLIDTRSITLSHVPSKENKSDIGTKVLVTLALRYAITLLGEVVYHLLSDT